MKNRIHWLGRLAVMLPLSLAGVAGQAETQFSTGISVPGVSIGINTPAYPQLVRVPHYPVYYAPDSQNNYFFYDGLYWVFQQDSWYSSSWYDGPWYAVGPRYVPLFVLRIPVRYYRNPPSYFGGWQRDAPPRWGEHWGSDWQRQRTGWDRWSRHASPAPAPLPAYQRQYSGERYPRVKREQQNLQGRNYHYQPLDAQVRQRYQQQAVPAAQSRRDQQAAPPRVQDQRGRSPSQDARPQASPRQQPQQRGSRGESRPQPEQSRERNRNNDDRAKGRDKDRNNDDGPGQRRNN